MRMWSKWKSRSQIHLVPRSESVPIKIRVLLYCMDCVTLHYMPQKWTRNAVISFNRPYFAIFMQIIPVCNIKLHISTYRISANIETQKCQCKCSYIWPQVPSTPGKASFCWSIPENLLQIHPDIHHSLCPRGISDHVPGGHKLSTSMRTRLLLWGWGMENKLEGKVTPSLDGLWTALTVREWWNATSHTVSKCSGLCFTCPPFPHLVRVTRRSLGNENSCSVFYVPTMTLFLFI